MAISDWPADQRPREKLLAQGPTTLTDAELLAIFLRTGVTGKSAVDLARELLDTFGSLRTLLKADLKEFCQAKGLGSAKYAQLQAVLEMGRRHLAEGIQRGEPLANSGEMQRYLQLELRDSPREIFVCLWLDNRHRIIELQKLFFGTLDGAAVYPREVVREALQRNAAAVVFAHNHPSGVAEPSQADKQITERLKGALQLVDVRVLDHIVVGDTACTSFAEWGWL